MAFYILLEVRGQHVELALSSGPKGPKAQTQLTNAHALPTEHHQCTDPVPAEHLVLVFAFKCHFQAISPLRNYIIYFQNLKFEVLHMPVIRGF